MANRIASQVEQEFAKDNPQGVIDEIIGELTGAFTVLGSDDEWTEAITFFVAKLGGRAAQMKFIHDAEEMVEDSGRRVGWAAVLLV